MIKAIARACQMLWLSPVMCILDSRVDDYMRAEKRSLIRFDPAQTKWFQKQVFTCPPPSCTAIPAPMAGAEGAAPQRIRTCVVVACELHSRSHLPIVGEVWSQAWLTTIFTHSHKKLPRPFALSAVGIDRLLAPSFPAPPSTSTALCVDIDPLLGDDGLQRQNETVRACTRAGICVMRQKSSARKTTDTSENAGSWTGGCMTRTQSC